MDKDTDMENNTGIELPGTPGSSRLGFLKLAAAASAGLVVGGRIPTLTAHAATDDPATIIGVALVAEYLAVTFQSNALRNAAAIGLRSDEITTIQSVVAQEAIHVVALTEYGAAAPYSGPFVFPAGTFTSRTGYANTAVVLETAFVAAYMAATREFAADARQDLAQLTFQVGAVEAEHRALSRAIGGFVPYSDVAFELNLIPNVAAAATFLTNTGFIPTGTPPATALPFLQSDLTAALGHISLLTQATP